MIYLLMYIMDLTFVIQLKDIAMVTNFGAKLTYPTIIWHTGIWIGEVVIPI